MKLLIWGAGAIGGTIGAYLARVGHDVTLVDVAAGHVEAINTSGLHITGPIDDFTVQVPAFTPDTVEGQWETVLLCVKAHHTEEAARALLPHVADDGYVVSVQNGLNERVISRIVGEERTVGAFVNFGADYMEPGVVHRGNRATVVVGELDGRASKRILALYKTFLDFDDQAILTRNIWGYLWGKLSYGALLFATALTNESIADALNLPDYRDLYIELGREPLKVAHERGVTPEAFDGFNPHAFLPDAEREQASQVIDDLVAFNRKSAKTHSGIWRDLAVRKRKTEVDAQLGPIVALGHEAGVPAPVTERLMHLIHDIEDGKRPLSVENLELLKLAMIGG